MHIRKRPFGVAIPFVAVLVALLGGCQTAGLRPEATLPAPPPAVAPEGQPIAASEAILNLALFFDPAAIIEVRRSGLGGIFVDRFLLRDGSGDGEIVSVHVRGNGRWNEDVAFQSEPAFREKADKILLSLREVKPIRRGESLTGYRAIGVSRKTAAHCVCGTLSPAAGKGWPKRSPASSNPPMTARVARSPSPFPATLALAGAVSYTPPAASPVAGRRPAPTT